MHGMADDSTPQWLTYAEAGERLGVSAEAVRARVIRKGWRRQLGNDRLARIIIPDDLPTPVQRPVNGQSTPVHRPSTTDALREHIATLKADNERLMTELAGERTARQADQEQLAAARAAADRATVELVELARRLAAIAEAQTAAAAESVEAEPEPPRRRLGRAWGWFLRN
jgi:hypothetical protein